MKKIRRKDELYYADYGSIKTRYHFSFGNYDDPNYKNYGPLRVVNDGIIESGEGYSMHSHKNMEIISYLINGKVTHTDSMKNLEILSRGEVQYISAGNGIFHSEHNFEEEELRLLQIWISPKEKNLEPNYNSVKFKAKERKNKFLKIVSEKEKEALIQINQDLNIYVAEIDSKKELFFDLENTRKVYIINIEGKTLINKDKLEEGDSIQINDIEKISIESIKDSHVLIFEMKK